MVVGDVSGERAPEMRLVEDDDVIETFAANRSDHAFDVRVLPRTRARRDDFTDAHAGDATLEQVAIDGVSIPQQPEWGGVLGKRLDELLGRPGGRRMLRDPDMDHVSTMMGHEDQDEEDASGEGWDGEEVHRHHGRQVIREEGAPGL